MGRTTFQAVLGVALLATLIGSAPATWAAERPEVEPLATRSATPSGIHWQLTAHHQLVVLRVSGRRFEKTEVVRNGANPSFRAVDTSGLPLADGLYNFELRAIPQPPADLVSAVEQARAEGDVEAYGRLSTELQNWGQDLEPIKQSGMFRMVGGSLKMIDDIDREVVK